MFYACVLAYMHIKNALSALHFHPPVYVHVHYRQPSNCFESNLVVWPCTLQFFYPKIFLPHLVTNTASGSRISFLPLPSHFLPTDLLCRGENVVFFVFTGGFTGTDIIICLLHVLNRLQKKVFKLYLKLKVFLVCFFAYLNLWVLLVLPSVCPLVRSLQPSNWSGPKIKGWFRQGRLSRNFNLASKYPSSPNYNWFQDSTAKGLITTFIFFFFA